MMIIIQNNLYGSSYCVCVSLNDHRTTRLQNRRLSALPHPQGGRCSRWLVKAN